MEQGSARSGMEQLPLACIRLSSSRCLRLGAESALGAADGHALVSTHPERVDLELGEGIEDGEQRLAVGSWGWRAWQRWESLTSRAAGSSPMARASGTEVAVGADALAGVTLPRTGLSGGLEPGRTASPAWIGITSTEWLMPTKASAVGV